MSAFTPWIANEKFVELRSIAESLSTLAVVMIAYVSDLMIISVNLTPNRSKKPAYASTETSTLQIVL